eukprot:TRINITY_DN12911_c0_g1_i1.p2 TRINITY_DN12911_c0_g1~~TRINITY_DN12911_c0_g1_i1.p2  ORF type:complete len:327 (-),score=85.09 TRINITY_DN12911_c0_g1_i1:9-989(-)
MSVSESSDDIGHDNHLRDDLDQGGDILHEDDRLVWEGHDDWKEDTPFDFYKSKHKRNKKVTVHGGIMTDELGFKVKFKHGFKKRKFLFAVASQGIRILDFTTQEELARFSYDRIVKFLYNKDLHVFQFIVKLTSITVERYTFHTKKSEEIFFAIKEQVTNNIKAGRGRTKKIVQASVSRIDFANHKVSTLDQEKRNDPDRVVTDIVERSTDSVSEKSEKSKKKKKATLLDISDRMQENFKGRSKSARDRSKSTSARPHSLTPPEGNQNGDSSASRKPKSARSKNTNLSPTDMNVKETRKRSKSTFAKPEERPMIQLEEDDMEVIDL